MEKREIKTITFYPKAIVEYVQKKGFITYTDLGKDLGYTNKFAQQIILDDMVKLSLLTIEDDDWELEWDHFIRKYKLTERAKKEKLYEGPIVFRMGSFPVIAKLTQKLMNELMEVAEARGMELKELTEMAESNPAKFQEMANKIRVAILNEYSSEELKELAIESKDFLTKKPKQ